MKRCKEQVYIRQWEKHSVCWTSLLSYFRNLRWKHFSASNPQWMTMISRLYLQEPKDCWKCFFRERLKNCAICEAQSLELKTLIAVTTAERNTNLKDKPSEMILTPFKFAWNGHGCCFCRTCESLKVSHFSFNLIPASGYLLAQVYAG